MKYSYLENRPLEEALAGYLDFLKPLLRPLKAETLAVFDACGRITANASHARLSSPHYNACAMDGIAVRASDTFGASELSPVVLDRFRPVDTGDPVPEGFDAVVMIEDVIFQDGRAVLRSAVCAWQHVRQIGEDLCQGDIIFPSYTRLTPAAVGALLAGGVTQVEVLQRVRVGIIPTGDELIPPGQTPKNGEIIEFNSPMLRAMLVQAGCEVLIYDIVPDRPERIKNALQAAVGENDIVFLNAGSSAGRDDYAKAVIEETGTVYSHGIAIRPGKPAILAACGPVPVIGLPGYPVSAAVVLEQLGLPVIAALTKNDPVPAHRVPAVLARRVLSGLKYQEFIRVKLGYIRDKLTAVPLGRGAGAVASLAKADGMIVIPRDSEGLEAGAEVEVSLLRPLEEIRRALVVTGSHDPMLDVIGDIMRQHTGFFLSSSHVGSMGGIMALQRGEAHIAPVHILEPATGRYNQLESYFQNNDVTLIKGVKRVQGIMVQKGNPHAIIKLEDLARDGVTYVNRQKGAGTRILLDFLLEKAGLSPADLYGYDNEEFTHTAVAAQIAGGNADAGLGVYSAASIFGLDFIPLADEEYDFLVPTEWLGLPQVQAFIDVLNADEFKRSLEKMGGYDR